MKFAWPVIVQLIALGVAWAEVIVPSFGLLGILSVGLAVYSWYYIVTELPRSAALIFGVADAILIPIVIRYGFKYLGRSPISHQQDLGLGSGLEDKDLELARHVGETVEVEAPLRPTGKVRIGAELYEAQTTGDFVDRGAQVRILSASGSRFFVEKIG